MEKTMSDITKEASTSRLELEDVNLYLKMQGTNLNIAAKEGAELEHHLSPWQAVKAYPMAIFWAVLVSMCVIMEGYDTILIGNFYAYPTFAKKYGIYFPEVGYQLTAAWQVGLGNASGVGAFFGGPSKRLLGWHIRPEACAPRLSHRFVGIDLHDLLCTKYLRFDGW
jgi:SP family general alpha glucoside:H+ symporter-like MFS transporter